MIILISIILTLSLLAFTFFIYKKTKSSPKRDSLLQPKSGLAIPLKNLFSSQKKIKEIIPELEEILLGADVGIHVTQKLIESLEKESKAQNLEEAYVFLKNKIKEIITPQKSFMLSGQKPFIIFFVGINGTGKTTTIGKLALKFKNEGKKVLMVAADTFRAAATEQLKIWALKSGVDIVTGQMKSDAASVVFDGLKAAKSRNSDVVLIDTAGRLHTKSSLMEELKKIVGVTQKECGRNPDEVFLTIDATTGQNGLNQALVFHEAIHLTGLVLTKYDGTSKGGILLSVIEKTGLPLRFIGVGEGVMDLREFNVDEFVEVMVGRE